MTLEIDSMKELLVIRFALRFVFSLDEADEERCGAFHGRQFRNGFHRTIMYEKGVGEHARGRRHEESAGGCIKCAPESLQIKGQQWKGFGHLVSPQLQARRIPHGCTIDGSTHWVEAQGSFTDFFRGTHVGGDLNWVIFSGHFGLEGGCSGGRGVLGSSLCLGS